MPHWPYLLIFPPEDSFVGKICSVFRLLAYIIAFPMITITALDVASYLIVRTLGAPFDLNKPSESTHTAPFSNNATLPISQVDAQSASRPMPPSLLPHSVSPKTAPPRTEPTRDILPESEDYVLELSGAHIVSPPASRAITPPPNVSSLTSTEAKTSTRRRISNLQMTLANAGIE